MQLFTVGLRISYIKTKYNLTKNATKNSADNLLCKLAVIFYLFLWLLVLNNKQVILQRPYLPSTIYSRKAVNKVVAKPLFICTTTSSTDYVSKEKKCITTSFISNFTFKSPLTPASSMASLTAASSTVSSYSHPPCEKMRMR